MLSADQFLPGTEGMREAKPHEQTESQFHNRPDVFIHGRYVSKAPGERNREGIFDGGLAGQGFHAGSEKAAHERLTNLGAPYAGHEARFYHGRVDPMHMQNTAQVGQWENDFPDTKSTVWHTPSRRTDDPGREADQGDEWAPKHHASYYRNDYEDAGSTSVILPTKPVKYTADMGGGLQWDRTDFKPKNFQTWRGAVGDALSAGESVPHHVRAIYEASGGVAGHHGVVHTGFDEPVRARSYDRDSVADRYGSRDEALPSATALGRQWD